MDKDEMGGWHHQLNGHALEQTPGGSEGQGSLVCCSSWGLKESDTTQQLNNRDMEINIKNDISCMNSQEVVR